MKYMLLIYHDERCVERDRAAGVLRGVHAARAPASLERAVSGRQPAAPDIHGDQRPGARRQTARDRRSVRGDARAARRLLPHRRQGSRRGDRHRRTDSHGAQGYRRGPAGDRDRGPADRSSVRDGVVPVALQRKTAGAVPLPVRGGAAHGWCRRGRERSPSPARGFRRGARRNRTAWKGSDGHQDLRQPAGQGSEPVDRVLHQRSATRSTRSSPTRRPRA